MSEAEAADDDGDGYDYWREELANPGCNSRDTNRRIFGFWRMIRTRTKPDYPVAIWPEATGNRVRIGRKEPIMLDAPDGIQFQQWGWMSTKAVTDDEYRRALETGVWSDDKPSRQPDDIANQPAAEGQANYVPVSTAIAEYADDLIERLKEITVTDQETANRAAEIVAKLRKAFKEGDAAWTKERAPHEEIVAKIKEVWKPILDRIEKAGKDGSTAVRLFLAAEEERIKRATEASTVVEETSGGDTSPQASPPPPSGRTGRAPNPVRASTNYGRATTLRTVKRGKITDQAKFIRAVKGDKDFTDLLQRKADALARAGTTKPGMEIETTRE